MSYIPEPITRIDKYLAYIAGNMDIAIPDHPITRKEHYLAAWAEKSGFEDVDVAGEPPLTLENGIGKPLKGLKIYGRSKQITTTGAQLLDYDNLMPDIAYGIGGTLQSNKGYVSSQLIKVTGNSPYTISGLGSVAVIILQYSSEKALLARKASNTNGTYTTLENACYIGLTFYAAVTVDMLKNTMLNAGTTPLPWEPYTGGKPSPSPDYPQKIESAGMRWSTGANLLDISQWNTYEKTYGLTCTIENDTVTIKGVYERPNYEIGTRIQAMYRLLRYKTGTTFPDGAKVVAQIIKGDGAEGIYVSSGLKENTPCIVIAFYAVTGQEVEIQLKPMIYVGDTAPEYEPYTGGIPKPYGDKIGVNVRGKNLLNPLRFFSGRTSNGITWNVKNNGEIVCEGTASGDSFLGAAIQYPDARWLKIPAGTYVLSGSSEHVMVYINTVALNGDKKGSYYCQYKSSIRCVFTEAVYITMQAMIRDGVAVTEETAYPQLELGDTATSYEPYHEPQFASIATPNGLPGIPVSSGGNYTDADGQQWICDEIDFARGVYVRRVWKGVFDGSDDERWGIYNNTTYAGFYLTNVFAEKLTMRDGIANTYKVDNSYIPIEAVWIGVNEKAIYIKNSRFYDDTLSDKGLSNFKDSLAAHPMTVMTYLDSPIETPLASDQLAAYKALRTYKGTTIIDNDAGAYMSVKYEKMK